MEPTSKFEKILFSISGVSPIRKLYGPVSGIYRVLAIFFSLFFIYCSGPAFLGQPDDGLKRGLFMLLMTSFIFLRYSFSAKHPSEKVQIIDWVLIAASIITFGYWALNFNSLSMRVGMFSDMEIFFAALAVIISFEVARRVLGIILPIISGIFVVYAALGNTLGIMSTSNFTLRKILAECYYANGIFGSILDISMSYVVLFVVFGGLMQAFGADSFFIEFPYSLTCGMRGGPGKTAVIASCLFGSISGSATANTAATGAFTIPLMIRTGYRREIAGAIEPVASTGGMFMPPVMGAATFLMAEMIGVPYSQIVVVGFAPALIYFLSVFMICHYQALADGIEPIPKNERPNPWQVFSSGWFFLIPVLVLLYLLLTYHSPTSSIYWTIVSMFCITLIARLIQNRNSQISPLQTVKKLLKDTANGLEEGTNGSLVIGSVVGNTGIIMAALLMTGLAFVFTSSIMTITGGSMVIGILIAFAAAYVLGMGLTVTAVYILLAILVVPGLTALGMDVMAAHFLVFWFSQTSNISPPVCVAAFVGASIAKANPYKVGFNSLRFASFLFLLPLLFVYSEILMPKGFTFNTAIAMFSAALATIPTAAGMTGFFRTRISMPVRLVLLGSALLLMLPDIFSSTSAIIILAIVWIKNNPKLKENKTTVV